MFTEFKAMLELLLLITEIIRKYFHPFRAPYKYYKITELTPHPKKIAGKQ